MTILNEFHRIKATDVVKIWIIPTFTVGAAIVLYLDWFYSCKKQGTGDPASISLLRDTLVALKAIGFDSNSRRGVDMLEGLVSQQLMPDHELWDEVTTPELDGLMAYLAENTVWEQ